MLVPARWYLQARALHVGAFAELNARVQTFNHLLQEVSCPFLGLSLLGHGSKIQAALPACLPALAALSCLLRFTQGILVLGRLPVTLILSLSCLLAHRTCLILLDWAAPLPDMVHMQCAPRERAATVRRQTPHALPFLGCLVLLA
eukprot:365152-Chlamydomonas_euryale.AAC.1